MERTTLHIVGGNSRSRAEQARVAFALGHHAEVYTDVAELLERPLLDGVVLAAEDTVPGGAEALIQCLRDGGVGLPIAVAAVEPETSRVVDAVKAGALDYLCLPLEMNDFARRLTRMQGEARKLEANWRFEIEARQRLSQLSARQREVLELLSAGCSNKEIGRLLGISPRTVEIHRANMMTKLGASHPADAVRLWLAAGSDLPEPEPEPEPRRGQDRVIGRIGRPQAPATGETLRRHRQ
ncbi:response regulator transcription factor [Altererythrobacter sp. B11]|uniref:response regulator transcription factor n=1 Tax=Altererythrobacter sp. B11 TaxID=2060312 RepID=UPI000E5AAF5B|nr:LuxR C-terminal-related transcriptional regulator [Altererythrobacter sp. B11]